MTTTQKTLKRQMRHARVRAKISGSAERPRLHVYRSNTHIYAQMIDDLSGKVLASANDQKIKSGSKSEKATKVGEELAKAASKAGVKACVFDTGGFGYKGRVKAVAEGVRAAGINF